MSALVFERFLSTPEIVAVFSENAVVQAMMDFEAALARAQAAEGMIPAATAQAIAGVCKAELFDVPALVAASGRCGSLAIPLVKKLTETVALFDAAAAGYVHWGSTSQDVIDTAMVLQTRRALALIDRDLSGLIGSLQSLAREHAGAPMLARTLMQPAQVVSFDFKLVSWIAPLVRAQQRLHDAGRAALQLQLGGAVGTLAVMGRHGAAVARRMADALQLGLPPGAWHTQRDALASLACEVGVLTGTLGKIAKDISLLAQAEVGELAEASGGGRGGSWAMPHKRNPVAHRACRSACRPCSARWCRSTSAGSATGRPSWPKAQGCTSPRTARSRRSPTPPARSKSMPRACEATSTRCTAWCSPRALRCCSRRASARRRHTLCWNVCRMNQ